MGEFKLQIDLHIFQRTNAAWNELMLNDPWSVGYVSSIIEYVDHPTKEDWETFYYQSGKERDQLIEQHQESEQVLNDFALVRVNRASIKALPPKIKQLNFNYGRTKTQLLQRAGVLLDSVKKDIANITLEDCFECVRFRTICQTWNGIMLRERKVVAALKVIFDNVEFRKTAGMFDHQYAVDYELFLGNALKCAIQIKPMSYLADRSYINKARFANHKKNENYTRNFAKPVFDIISDSNGQVQNKQVISEISKLLT